VTEVVKDKDLTLELFECCCAALVCIKDQPEFWAEEAMLEKTIARYRALHGTRYDNETW
jgi:hypothetical protein